MRALTPPEPPQSAAELREGLGEPLGGSGGALGELWEALYRQNGSAAAQKCYF